MGRFDGKIAIVTGAAQGMGEAHARPFVENGARLMLFLASDEASFVSRAGHVDDRAMLAV